MIEILILCVLICTNAFFAASEIALISLNGRKLEVLADEGNKKASIVLGFLQNPSQFLATIQIGITLAGFLASAFAAGSFADDVADWLLGIGLNIPRVTLETISVIVITLLLSYVTLVLGELVPKRLAMKKAEAISLLAARPLKLINAIALPFVKLLTLSTNGIVRLFGMDPHANEEQLSEEEIRMIIEDGKQHGTILESEQWMIDNIFELDNKDVSDVMTHRIHIAAIPAEASLPEIIHIVSTEKHTRFPVYEESIDRIIGILHVKDLIPYIAKGQQGTFNLKKLLYAPYFVSEFKRTDLMLKEMQREKLQMAVVLDEYGGTAGIVTIKDLVEEIVGELFDEYDGEDENVIEIDSHTFLVSGLISLDEAQEFFQVKLPIDEYDTLSGFLIAQIGYIPEQGEHPVVEWDELVFKVEDADGKRIVRVKVSKSYSGKGVF